MTAIIPVIIKAAIEILLYFEKKLNNNPAQAKGGPGKTGTKAPISPTTSKMPAPIENKILAVIVTPE